MLQRRVTVVHEVDLRLIAPGDEGLRLTATLRYQPSDPYAVEATFRAGDEAISWVLGRDLLSEGLTRESGEGDVRVWPTTDVLERNDPRQVVLLQLSSPDGRALLAAPADDVAAFLAETYEVVPPGTEGDHIDIDGVVERLLA
jgi:Streptomyces sporulation and cell division protein, SsgA